MPKEDRTTKYHLVSCMMFSQIDLAHAAQVIPHIAHSSFHMECKPNKDNQT